jgi:hypothetical protein
MEVLCKNFDYVFFPKRNETIEEIVSKWDRWFDFKTFFKNYDIDVEKLSLSLNDMAKYLIENDFEEKNNLNVVMFPIIIRLMEKYKITEFDNKDLVNTWFEKSDKLYKIFERSSNISDIDVEAEVCDLFSKIYVCKIIEDGKYKLEKVKS